jgi:uncharacterized protein YjiS (DUF1127 family)
MRSRRSAGAIETEEDAMSLTLSIPFVAEPAVTRHPRREAFRQWRAARSERRRMRAARYEFARLDAQLLRDIGGAGETCLAQPAPSRVRTLEETRDVYLHLAV